MEDVLGPRNGPFERLSSSENPLNEYLTGVIIPVKQYSETLEEKESQEELIGNDAGKDEIEDTSDDTIGQAPVASPSLDPKRKPSSMGITFFIESSDTSFQVCVTWGKYDEVTENGESFYQRSPMSKVLQIPLSGSDKLRLSEDKEIYLQFYTTSVKLGAKKRVSVFIVNGIEPKDRYRTEINDCIFQPQIRIKLGSNTKLAKESNNFVGDTVDSEMALLYRHRDFGVKGHLCSVILKEFDPQVFKNNSQKTYSQKALDSPAFKWIDGYISKILTEKEKKEFSEPDLRTEFVPMYSVPGPEYELSDKDGNPLTFYAKDLAEVWNPDELNLKLSPMLEVFGNWIESNKREILNHNDKEREILSRLSGETTLSLHRMKKGLDLLLTDEKARLAFCLSNRAMELQYQWEKKNKELQWRPFQIAYFLLTIESIFNSNSEDRAVCDLLWVATGGGKTEAYMAIIAFTVVLRRLKKLGDSDEGAGTSVITRYTLRLLAIQQFRRTLSLITALEYLRVIEFANKKIGWRPVGYNREANFILGVSPFTIGLWVGSGVTPNKLEEAIGGLKEVSKESDTSEPAQITTCPACHSTLSIPSEGLQKGKHVLFIIVKTHQGNLQSGVPREVSKSSKILLNNLEIKQNSNDKFTTLKLEFEAKDRLTINEIDYFLNNVMTNLKKYDKSLEIASSHITKPGYFLRTYINKNKLPDEYNFEIYCPNPGCPLSVKWFAGTPAGMIHNQDIEEFLTEKGISINGTLKLKDIIEPFQMGDIHYSDRIQIPALTVDDQIYMNPPTVLLSTVDKFARPAFEPRSAVMFGNYDYFHPIFGYYRENLHGRGSGPHPSPSGRSTPLYIKVKKGAPPDLILQDELHLIEGPLGGMVGMYETAVDYLSSEETGTKAKYIASTATIRNAEDQVKAVFARKVHMFPPYGNNSDNRFFVRESEIHPLEEEPPGRLYLGIAAPGRGPLTPIYRILARLLQTGWKNKDNPEVDRFWTVTGYFNSIRELAGAVALYRQDIPQQLRIIGDAGYRDLSEDRKVELSSRVNSTELPSILEVLNRNYTPGKDESVDALFTTSLFGTGIDIPRLGLMLVNGQPKTTSSYIQSTGRIGRARGGLIVTFLRASRPRDLSHYEYFTGFHRQLHRFVEPVSAYPFAPKIMERTLGPVSVFMLRNTRINDVQWYLDQNSGEMPKFRQSSSMVANLKGIFESRAQEQPDMKKPPLGMTGNKTMEKIDTWEQENRRSTGNARRVRYVEYFKAESDVILGDAIHRRSNTVTTVFDDAPQSLRDIEETTSFET
ncbi:MAG: DISARM system helicase DrmA [Thermoplasmatales archaeon]